jgi:exodeoxyribonuclease VIII
MQWNLGWILGSMMVWAWMYLAFYVHPSDDGKRKQARHVVIDLETLGTGPNAVIFAIGAVVVDVRKPGFWVDVTWGWFFGHLIRKLFRRPCVLKDKPEEAFFYKHIDPQSCTAFGLVTDADTVKWWDKQSPEAREELVFAQNFGHQLPKALAEFSAWYNLNAFGLPVWGNGATFDNVILSNAYNAAGLDRPWGRFGDQCYRTLKNLHPDVKMHRIGEHHHALADAVTQGMHLVDIFRAKRLY